MREIVAHLLELGITENDAVVYICLLESGTVKMADLTERTGIQRPRVYDSLNRLIERGLALKDLTQATPRYRSTDLKVALAELHRQISQKEEAIAALSKELDETAGLKLPRGVAFYQASAAATQQIQRILSLAQKRITILAVLPCALPDQDLLPRQVLSDLSAAGGKVTLILSVQSVNRQDCVKLAAVKNVQVCHYPEVGAIRTVFHRVDGAALCVSPVARYDDKRLTLRHSLHFYQERGMIQAFDLILQGYLAQSVPLDERLQELDA